MPGVKDVTYANWFGGAYQDPHNQKSVPASRSRPNYLDLYPEVVVPPDQRKAFDETRTGALVGEAAREALNWKVGDKIPLQSRSSRTRRAATTGPSTSSASSRPPRRSSAALDHQLLFHWKYFDEAARPQRARSAGTSRGSTSEPGRHVAKAIDALSANSDHETQTQTEQAFNLAFVKQLADIGLIVGAIMGAVFFTLLLLTGNTMMQAVRERIPELAVLKTIGFSNRSVLGMVLAESMLLLVLGGVLGLLLAQLLMPVISAGSGGKMNLPPSAPTWSLGIALMLGIGLVVGVLPALRAMRLNIVDALAGR